LRASEGAKTSAEAQKSRSVTPAVATIAQLIPGGTESTDGIGPISRVLKIENLKDDGYFVADLVQYEQYTMRQDKTWSGTGSTTSFTLSLSCLMENSFCCHGQYDNRVHPASRRGRLSGSSLSMPILQAICIDSFASLPRLSQETPELTQVHRNRRDGCCSSAACCAPLSAGYRENAKRRQR